MQRFARSVLKSNFGYAQLPVFSNTIYKQRTTEHQQLKR
ncbi:hypothetical protein I600_206 [Maribacter dokdonensis DSW-8]|nr:hypothetical protein I600_206 [Maribacter dokdonensis DSW-8]